MVSKVFLLGKRGSYRRWFAFRSNPFRIQNLIDQLALGICFPQSLCAKDGFLEQKTYAVMMLVKVRVLLRKIKTCEVVPLLTCCCRF